MSSLCPERPSRLRAAALTLLAFGAPAAGAADVYFQPRMDASVNADSNLDLVTSGPKSWTEGYVADFGGTLNYLTPESTVIFRPQLGYQDYPQLSQTEFIAIGDLYSDYKTQRTDFTVSGRFDRRNTYSSELPEATFNPVNPTQPTAPETGRVNASDTRTLGSISPSFTYDISRRLGWGVSGVFQEADYSGPNSNEYVPFNYYVGSTSLDWAATPTLGTKLTAFGSRESAKDGSGSVDGGGVTLGFDYKWSSQFTTHLEVLGERDDSNFVRPTRISTTSTSGGATVGTKWKGEISSVIFSAGRTFTPSGAGGVDALDQVQVEYHRDLSPRWKLTAAGIYDRYTPIVSATAASNYTYVNLEASLKWMWTPVWYVATGAEYLVDKSGAPIGSASNDMVYVQFGYEGLSR